MVTGHPLPSLDPLFCKNCREPSMETLFELLKTLKNYAPSPIAVLPGNPSDQEPPYLAFFHAWQAGQICSAEAGAAWLKLAPEDPRYTQFLDQLITRLHHSLLFSAISLPEWDDPARAVALCWQRLGALRNLVSLGSQAVVSVGEAVLAMAQLLEIPAIVVECAQILRQYHAVQLGDAEASASYHRLIQQYWQEVAAEAAAQGWLEQFHLAQVLGTKPHLDLVEKALVDLRPWVGKAHSSGFLHAFGLLQVHHGLLTNSWSRAIEVVRQLRQQLAAKPATTAAMHQTWWRLEASARLHQGNWSEALVALGQAISQEAIGSKRWFCWQEEACQILLHQGDYPTAWQLAKKLVRQPAFFQQTEDQQKRIGLLHLWLLTLADQGQLVLSPREKGDYTLFHQRCLDHHPPNPHANLVNLAESLLRILRWHWRGACYHRDKAWQQLEASIETLARPRSDFQRLLTFVELVGQLARCQWQSKAISRGKEDQLLEKLNHLPLTFGRAISVFEYLPFDQQWRWFKAPPQMQDHGTAQRTSPIA